MLRARKEQRLGCDDFQQEQAMEPRGTAALAVNAKHRENSFRDKLQYF
jgi:hypothetical protein